MLIQHWIKSVRIRSYFGPHFPAFGLNTERYGVSLHIQSKCGKMRTRITPNTDIFHVIHTTLKAHFLSVALRGIWYVNGWVWGWSRGKRGDKIQSLQSLWEIYDITKILNSDGKPLIESSESCLVFVLFVIVLCVWGGRRSVGIIALLSNYKWHWSLSADA